VLRYDKRGHGESDVPEGPYSFELLANDVLALLEALNITHTHFIGLSMGGMTGMTLALQQPSVLRSLVLCDTASADPLGDPTLWQERIDALKGSDSMEPLVERTIERFLAPATVQSRPETVAAVRDMIRHTPVQGYIACCQALAKLHLTERLPGIQIPTLVVVGEQDVATPVALARDIQQHIPGAELVILKDAGHLSNIDQPEAFNKAVLEFLARH
jgi:3-oxoadipate enol-lactonase